MRCASGRVATATTRRARATTITGRQSGGVAIGRGAAPSTKPTTAPDGSRIYFASDHDLEPYYKLPKTTIYSVPATGGDTAEVARFAGGLGKISVSPQGDRLAFLGSLSKPVQSYRKTELWVVDLAGGAAQRRPGLLAAHGIDPSRTHW